MYIICKCKYLVDTISQNKRSRLIVQVDTISQSRKQFLYNTESDSRRKKSPVQPPSKIWWFYTSLPNWQFLVDWDWFTPSCLDCLTSSSASLHSKSLTLIPFEESAQGKAIPMKRIPCDSQSCVVHVRGPMCRITSLAGKTLYYAIPIESSIRLGVWSAHSIWDHCGRLSINGVKNLVKKKPYCKYRPRRSRSVPNERERNSKRRKPLVHTYFRLNISYYSNSVKEAPRSQAIDSLHFSFSRY